MCWGANWAGQLGNGTADDVADAKILVPLAHVAEVAPGVGFTCARTSLGAVYCWGDNSMGQLGDGTGLPQYDPTAVTLPRPATQIVAGLAHACALLNDNSTWCWGVVGLDLDFFDPQYAYSPVAMAGTPSFVELSTSITWLDHTCGRTADGHVWCWGENANMQLGLGTLTDYENTPAEVVGISNATNISLASGYGCALLASGEVWCWGLPDDSITLVPFDGSGLAQRIDPGLSDAIVEIHTNDYRLCARTSAGEFVCWGRNYSGSFASPAHFDSEVIAPESIGRLTNVIHASIGDSVSANGGCAVEVGGTTVCWGANGSGQAGQPRATAVVSEPALLEAP